MTALLLTGMPSKKSHFTPKKRLCPISAAHQCKRSPWKKIPKLINVPVRLFGTPEYYKNYVHIAISKVVFSSIVIIESAD